MVDNAPDAFRSDERMKFLRRYEEIGAPRGEAMDRLTELVAHLFEVPIALISLVGQDRQWSHSGIGTCCLEESSDIPFCGYALTSKEVLVVEDASKDERFADHPLVTGDLGIRFYAGAPLETPDGFHIGVLCVMGRETRSISETDKERLSKFTALAMDELELQRESAVRERIERQYSLQSEVLNKINEGVSVQPILSEMLEAIEEQRPEMIASILLYDEEAGYLQHGAAPSLPDAYNEAVKGIPIGPRAGSCGTAIYTGEAVVTEDIATDPRWENYKELALAYGLKACWATPIESSNGELMGSFAIYYEEAGAPSEGDREIIEDGCRLALLAIERHRDQEALRTKEHRLDAIFEDPNILVGLLTTEGRVVDINDTAMNYIEESLDEVKDKLFWKTSWFSESASEKVRRWTQRAAHGEFVEFELDLTPDTQEHRTINGVFRPVFDEHGEVVSVLVSDRDITEQKYAQERLKAQKEWFRSIADNVADGIFRTSRETGKLEYANQALIEMFGFGSPDELMQIDVADLYADMEERERLFDILDEEGRLDGMEVRYRRKDGSTFPTLLSSTVVYDDNGTPRYHDGAVTDITAQKEAEQALRQSRDFLRRTEEMAGVGGWEVDVKYDSLRWTVGTRVIHGVARDYQPTLDQAWDFFHPDDRDTVRQSVEHCIETGEPFVIESRIIRADDAIRWVCIKGGVLREGSSSDSDIVKLRGTILDTTDQKETGQALRESEGKLRALANSIPGVLYQFQVDPEGSYSFRYVSDQVISLLGLTPDATFEELIDCIPESYRSEFISTIEEAIAQKAAKSIEFPLVKPSGEKLWLHAKSHPEETPSGLIFNGVLLDITEKKKAERENRVLVAAIEHAGESILITEADPEPPGPRILYVNPAFEEMTGYEKDEALGETPRLLYGPETDHALLSHLRTRLAQGETFTGETVHYRKDGSPFVLNWTVAPVYGESDQIEYFVAVQRDVTEEHQREKYLRQAKEEAEEVAELKSALLSNISHEIRTPLTSVIGFAEALEEMDLGEQSREFTQLIRQSGQRLLATLNSVLDLSRLQAGTMVLNPERLEVDSWVRDIVNGFRPQATKAQVQLSVVNPGKPTYVVIDDAALHRVVANLIGNAIKFTPQGGYVIVRVEEDDQHVVFEVEDTGVGIDPAFLPDLFEPFYQESTGTTRDYEGVGLGLAISKRIVDLLGGEIDVESQKGVGTRCRLWLPR